MEQEEVQATQPATESVAESAQQFPVKGVKWYKKWWIWLIVAIIVIAVGVGIYLWLG